MYIINYKKISSKVSEVNVCKRSVLYDHISKQSTWATNKDKYIFTKMDCTILWMGLGARITSRAFNVVRVSSISYYLKSNNN